MDERARVLIAEDETIIRLDLKDLLERAGFDVCAAARNGLEAVDQARATEPDLAILDVNMPLLDGIEAARRILAQRPIPIVMLTAYGQEELVARAIDAGVFGYLVKPFRETDLLPAIRTARARHADLASRPEPPPVSRIDIPSPSTREGARPLQFTRRADGSLHVTRAPGSGEAAS